MKTNDQSITDQYAMYNSDCIEAMASLPSDSIDFSIYSPPFSSLYTYSNSERDLGNCKDYDEFSEHYRFVVNEIYRLLKPGRIVAVHCMPLPLTKERDGEIGIRDFRGDIVRLHQSCGFIYHSEVTIWKDPVTAMQRTKSIGLLYKQLRKDSCISRQGYPDYLCMFRKPGVNPEPVRKYYAQDDYNEDGNVGDDAGAIFPVDLWQQYASPVWMDINPYDTLQRESAREEKDERHIAPLQLEVIRRAIRLWTNKNDVVLSPFAGIGSEGFASIELHRRFVGAELKRSYYCQAVNNLNAAVVRRGQSCLFEELVA